MKIEPLECEKIAQLLMMHATQLSKAHQIIRELCNTAPDTMRAEMDSLDAMDDHAERLVSAMRSIAMRLDRGAMGKFNPVA
jgi:hypothetical protein